MHNNFKEVKIVIGANYGDEGKGLMTRNFALDAKKKGKKPIVIFHNGTAQRGHTVDYLPDFRHIYHHFGSATAEKVPTFFADSFFIHPMEYRREFYELQTKNITPPFGFFDPKAKVITPFDMLVDQTTEEWIAKIKGEREFGSCGYGSWCAIEDRFPLGKTAYTMQDFMHFEQIPFYMEEILKDCLTILAKRGVKLEQTSFIDYFFKHKKNIIDNFIYDIRFFCSNNGMLDFYNLYNNTIFNYFIFENGQGLGLDVNVDNDWHTTSNTGLLNPYNLLKNEKDFNAEVCYVTRTYLTRHGMGPLEQEVHKKYINKDITDKTNIFNNFQGGLRFGMNDDFKAMNERIINDFQIAENHSLFIPTLAVTHINEFENKELINCAKYVSNNPFQVLSKF